MSVRCCRTNAQKAGTPHQQTKRSEEGSHDQPSSNSTGGAGLKWVTEMTDTNETKLPCPFCGADSYLWWDHDGVRASCSDTLYCLATGPVRETVALALAAWDTRPASDGDAE